jgi:hypothetical protein
MQQNVSEGDRFGLCNGYRSRFASEIAPYGTSDDVSECPLVEEILRHLPFSDHGNKARGPHDLAEISERSSAANPVNKPEPQDNPIGLKGHRLHFQFGATIGRARSIERAYRRNEYQLSDVG